MITIVLISLIAHFISDFVFQSEKIIKGRFPEESTLATAFKKIIKANFYHASINGVATLIILIIYRYLTGAKGELFILKIVLVMFAHFLIDLGKSILVLKNRNLKCNPWLFVGDQFLHILSIVFIFNLGKERAFINLLYSNIKIFPNGLKGEDRILLVIAILLFATYAVGYFVKTLLGSMASSNLPSNNEAKNGGFIIGILERLFIIVGIVIKQPSILVMVLTLKSVARYKKFSEDTFVEYFIIGTFLSIIFAILSGVIISRIISVSIN